MDITAIAVLLTVLLMGVFARSLWGPRGRRRMFGWIGRWPTALVNLLIPSGIREDRMLMYEQQLSYLNDPLRGAPQRYRWLQGTGLVLGVTFGFALAAWMSQGNRSVPTALPGMTSIVGTASTETAPLDYARLVGIVLAIALGFIGWAYPVAALRAKVARRKQRLLLQLADLLELMSITMRAGAEFDQALETAGRTIYERFLRKPDQYPLGVELAQALFERNMGVSRADFMSSLGLRATMRKERDENEFSDAAVTLWDELTQAVTLSQEVGSSLRDTLPEIVDRVRNGRLKAAELAAASARVTIIYPQGLLVLALMATLLASVGLFISNLSLQP